VSLLNVVVFSTVYSSGPAADDIHDDAAFSDLNSIPAVATINTVLPVLLSLLFLILLAFLLL
jgi:hypothetical protein